MNGAIGEREAIDRILQAKEIGRTIVPFLGAGISAGSGFPLVDSLRLYLLKVRFFIQYGAYRKAIGLPSDRNSPISDPEHNPSRYLTDFGWPNPNQLNSDLYRITRVDNNSQPTAPVRAFSQLLPFPPTCPKEISVTTYKKMRAAIESLNLLPDKKLLCESRCDTAWIDRHVIGGYESLLSAPPFVDLPSSLSDRQWATAFKRIQGLFEYTNATQLTSSRWGRRRWRLTTAALMAQLEDIRLYDQRLAEAIQDKVWRHELMPTTDWSRHLMQLSEGNLNLIDALISMLGLRYAPGLSHRMMAQLVKSLNLPLLLTINFDPYLEQALNDEGIIPRVLDVSRDDDPPDVSVVKQALSIIKLHGSSHSIRLGERLDYALDDDTRHRVERFVEDDSLLLVLGFSGYERRMMQLIDHLTTRAPRNSLKVLWMHFEPEDRLPATLTDFRRRLHALDRSSQLYTARLSDAGEFLFHLYQKSEEAYPRVRVPVTILPKRVIDLPRSDGTPMTETPTPAASTAARRLSRLEEETALHFFVEEELIRASRRTPAGRSQHPDPQGVSSSEASLRLSRFAQSKKDYNLIWIDLEEHHTVSGIVTDIVDRMRVFDPDLAPLVQPIDSIAGNNPRSFLKPVRFLHRALQRGRYVLAFDTLEDFGREHTSHHGLPSDFPLVDHSSDSRRRRLLDRVDSLLMFLKALLQVEEPARSTFEQVRVSDLDWYCGVSCSLPRPRHDTTLTSHGEELVVDTVRSKLAAFFKSVLERRDEKRQLLSLRIDNDVAAKSGDQREQFDALVHVLSTKPPMTDLDAAGDGLLSRLRRGRVSADIRHNSSKKSLCQNDVNTAISDFFSRVIHDRCNDVVSHCNSEATWLTTPSSPLLALLMLSAARRPRSFVAIRSLWCEYMPPEWRIDRTKRTRLVSDMLERLEGQKVLALMPGGFYWIPHRLHKKAYGFLTEPIRRKRIQQIDFSGPEATREWCITVQRLVFVVMLHARLSRFYYLHVFQRTHDTNSLFEYLYHRVSSIKYLSSLRTLLAQPIEHRWKSHLTGEDWLGVQMAMEALLTTESPGTTESATTSQLRMRDVEALAGAVDIVRDRWIRALTNVFKREQEAFQSQGSADTWLAWIEQILEHDIDFFFCADSVPAKSRIKLSGNRSADIGHSVSRLRGQLQDLQSLLLREKRDWEQCAHLRVAHLKQWCTHISSLLEPSGQARKRGGRSTLGETLRRYGSLSAEQIFGRLTDSRTEEKFGTPESATNYKHSLIASITAAIMEHKTEWTNWSAASVVEDVERLLGILEDLARCCHHNRWIACAQPLQGSVTGENGKSTASRILDSIEVIVSSVHGAATSLLAEYVRVGRSTLVTHGLRRIASAMEAWEVKLAFERVRLHVGKLDPWSCERSEKETSELDALCWRLERARHHTRGSDSVEISQFPLRRCQLRTLQARILTYLGRCGEARLLLSQAETGLNEDTLVQRFQLAIVAEFRAQTWMREADSIVECAETNARNERNDRSATITVSEVAAKASGRLADAGQSLREAERLLARGRRSTGQWLRLYAAKAQIEIEHLLLMLFEMEEPIVRVGVKGEIHFRAQLYNSLHRGLEAVRSGWDCVQAPIRSGVVSEQSLGLARTERTPWLARWSQLMVLGFMVLERYSRVFAVEQSDKHVESEVASADQIDAIYDTQNRISDRDKYNEMWIALNESVGLQGFLEQEKNKSSLWRQLMKEAESAVAMLRDDHGQRISRRRLANCVVQLMVSKVPYTGVCKDKYSRLRVAYTKWRDERVKGESGRD